MPFLNSIKENLKTKFYIILITFFYVFGLFAVFSEYKNIFVIIIALSCAIFLFILDFDIKKTIALFLFFILGVVRANQSFDNVDSLSNLNLKNVQIIGKVISNSSISTKTNRIKFFVDVDKAKFNNVDLKIVKSRLLITSDYTDNFKNLAIGDTVSINGKLKPPKEKTNPYQFDYKKYLLFKDCKNVLYGNEGSFKIISPPKLKNDPWYYVLNHFEQTRNKIINKHSKNIKSPKLEILGGIVFGNETINPDEKIKESFKNSGLLHLLAASGLNVALIYGIWYKIASLMRLPFHITIMFGIVFIILYTFMTGFPPSILRASTMLLFVLFGKLINRDANSVSLIFFVGFLILLFNPKMLYDVGFELSFMVTIGLIVSCEPIISKLKAKEEKFKEKYSKLPKIKRNFIYLFSPISLTNVVLVPLVAQLWVIPLQMHYFNNIAPLSILANIAVVPFIGILSFIGFVSSILALIPFLNKFFVYIFDLIANPMLDLLIKISDFFSSFKYSLVSVVAMNVFQMFGFWTILLLLILNIKNNFKNKIQLYVLIILTIITIISFIKIDNHNFEINMFDVENADCFLIKTPNNKYFMIDTGKSNFKQYSDAKAIVIPYIKNQRIKSLETLIITHYDIDHSGGAIDILKEMNVKNVILQRNNDTSRISKDIINYLKENKINFEFAKNDNVIYEDKDIKIKTYISYLKDDNEDSIVTLITHKGKNFLFTGDCSLVGYNVIKNYLPNKIDILKVGHHGAKGVIDNEMVKKLKPDYALISAGHTNFDHPHPDTTNVLVENKIKILLTKNYGFSKVILNDKGYRFIHFENNKFNTVKFDRIEEAFVNSIWFKQFLAKLKPING